MDVGRFNFGMKAKRPYFENRWPIGFPALRPRTASILRRGALEDPATPSFLERPIVFRRSMTECRSATIKGAATSADRHDDGGDDKMDSSRDHFSGFTARFYPLCAPQLHLSPMPIRDTKGGSVGKKHV
ncbi:hypothetical protein HPB50_014310 [Hyalomma asiaticum]|uniref:Uncharacterized protein n=1 Tax=Hyalomma asiaticum TaxID=266040 RepID=A0ACB7T0X3_HYAAI|nr:hypothetical protein HPB50_014310 [Hyalomma asiaticum]